MKLNQMTRRQRTAILVGALVILAVCVLAVGSILILSANQPKTHSEYLEAAAKYAEADDFENAKSTYWAAIQSNKYDTRGYTALSRLYLEDGDYESALQVLDIGVQNTGSQELSEQREDAVQQQEEETQLAQTQSGGTQNTSSSSSSSSSGALRSTSGTVQSGNNSSSAAAASDSTAKNQTKANTGDKRSGATGTSGTEQELSENDSKKPGSTETDDAQNTSGADNGSGSADAADNTDDTDSSASDPSDDKKNTGSDSDDSDTEPDVDLNTGLLEDFREYTYEDFEEAYGEAEFGSTSDGLTKVTFEGFEGVAYFDMDDDDEPDETDMPEKIELNQLNLLFKGMGTEDTLTLEQIQTSDEALEDAEISTENGRTVVEFITCGCAVKLEADDEGTVERDAWNSITSLDRAENTTDKEPDEDEEEEEGSAKSKKSAAKSDDEDEDDDEDDDDEKVCTLEGTLTDERTDEEIEGAELGLYKGSGSGKKLAECETDEDGDYSFEELAEGKYTVKIEAEGYRDKTVTVELEDEETSEDIELSPHEIRIELSWKEGAQDLDSHLDGETEDGEEIEIGPSHKEAKEDGETLAELDKDVRDGKGAETITLYALDGEYTYTVKDKTGKLNKSEAVVKLYYDDRLEEEYTVPASAKNEWEVFTLEDGEPKEED